MAYAALSELDDWHLVHPDQDIRGWKVIDSAGETIGRVDELLVSTDRELVEAVRLDDGTQVSAEDVEIGDRVVYLRGQRPAPVVEETEPVVQVYRDTRIQRRAIDAEETGTTAGASGAATGPGTIGAGAATTGNTGNTIAGTSGTLGGTTGTEGRSSHHRPATSPTFPTGFNEMHNDFRNHYSTMFGETGREYHFYEPAYAYGYQCALNDAYAGREWHALEPEVRTTYEREHGTGTWAQVKDAVRHGFQRGRGYRSVRHD